MGRLAAYVASERASDGRVRPSKPPRPRDPRNRRLHVALVGMAIAIAIYLVGGWRGWGYDVTRGEFFVVAVLYAIAWLPLLALRSHAFRWLAPVWIVVWSLLTIWPLFLTPLVAALPLLLATIPRPPEAEVRRAVLGSSALAVGAIVAFGYLAIPDHGPLVTVCFSRLETVEEWRSLSADVDIRGPYGGGSHSDLRTVLELEYDASGEDVALLVERARSKPFVADVHRGDVACAPS